MIRQYRRAAGEKSADEVERKLARLADLERKTQQQESIITELRREIEELKAKGIGGDMSISEFQTAIKKWEDVVETQKNIIRDRDNEIANLRARIAAPEGEGAPIPASLRRTPR
jgi:chromosome segregation ATPase